MSLIAAHTLKQLHVRKNLMCSFCAVTEEKMGRVKVIDFIFSNLHRSSDEVERKMKITKRGEKAHIQEQHGGGERCILGRVVRN